MSPVFRIVSVSVIVLGTACPLAEIVDAAKQAASEAGVGRPTTQPRPATVEGPLVAGMDVATTPPFVGSDGVDAHGYPRQVPDRAALLNSLRLRRFDDLDRFFEHYQSAFEADFRHEYWPDLALSAFYVPEPRLGELIDEWIAATPDSFAAVAARGNHRYAVGWQYRGERYSKDTSDAQFEAMTKMFTQARADFERALQLRPRFVAANRRLMQIAGSDGGTTTTRVEFDRAAANCADCFLIRKHYLQRLTPRWGGSYPKMAAFIEESKPVVARNPRIAWLAGYPDLDRCALAHQQKNYLAAHAACDAALAHGDDAEFLVRKAWLHRVDKRYADMLPLLARALEQDPSDREALYQRYMAHRELHDWRNAAADLVLLRRISPTDENVARDVDTMVKRMAYEGDQLTKKGKADEAAEYFSLGLALSPDDKDLFQRQGWNQKGRSSDEIQQELAANPDDYEAHLRADHGLAAEKRFDEVVALWDAFIARHPDDPRAYNERGGAKWQLRRGKAALADLEKACELGMDAACARVPKIRARVGQ